MPIAIRACAVNKVSMNITCRREAAKCRYRMTKCRPRNLSLQGIPRYHKRCIEPFCENSDRQQDNDFLKTKASSFITDENGENRYFT